MDQVDQMLQSTSRDVYTETERCNIFLWQINNFESQWQSVRMLPPLEKGSENSKIYRFIEN